MFKEDAAFSVDIIMFPFLTHQEIGFWKASLPDLLAGEFTT